MEAGTRRTWLAPEDRMRRLSVHGKSPEPPYSTASRASEAFPASATKHTPRNKKGKQLESPNTPFDGAEEFSHTTSGAGGSLQSPSEVDSGSQSKRQAAGSGKPALTPKAPWDGKAVQDAFPSRVSSAASEREAKRSTKYHPAGIPIPQRPSSLPAGESRDSPLPSARREKGDRAEGDQHTGADTPLQRRGETKRAGWFQNDTYAAESSAAVPGWKRPSITVPAEGDASHSRRLSSSAAGSSLPWPAISPKEAVTAEQEAWYIEQVAGALSGREHAVETIQALLRSLRARTVSSVAAMHQVAALLAGHPILIEGFTAFLPDKAAFLQLDDRAGGPAHPLHGFQKGTAPAEGAPLMRGAQSRYAAGLDSAQAGGRGRRVRAQAARSTAAGGRLRGCTCWRHFKATQSRGWHLPWWTMAFSVASVAVFMYMAGNYGIFHLLQQDLTQPDAASAQSPDDRVAQLGFTPAGLRAWFGAAPGWRSFDGGYLVAWGARYLPDVARGRWWLWATSGLLHTDFMHVAGSLLPWAVLSFLLEVNYGSVRVFLLCLVSLLGGAFTSAVLDPSCQVVVGCNGALMGALPWLFGAFLADFPVISWSWLQLPLAVCAIILHLIVAILQRDVPHHSNWADMGGFLCGLLPAVLFLPCPSDPRWAMAKRLLGSAGKRCRPCHACGCAAPRTASSELALADAAASDEEEPTQARASERSTRTAAALRNPLEAGDVSLDMQRYYDKHQMPSLASYDKSLRSQWDVEQPMGSYSLKAGSIAAHRGSAVPSQSPAVQRMEARPRSTSPQMVSADVRGSAESLLTTRQALSIDTNAATHEEHPMAASAGARDMEDGGCCACANVIHGLFCIFSVIVFLGILVAAPVYMYLVKLPKLACDATV